MEQPGAEGQGPLMLDVGVRCRRHRQEKGSVYTDAVGSTMISRPTGGLPGEVATERGRGETPWMYPRSC